MENSIGCIVDVETTGLTPGEDEIIEFAAILFSFNKDCITKVQFDFGYFYVFQIIVVCSIIKQERIFLYIWRIIMYFYTALEEQIKSIYRHVDILSPSDIDLIKISANLSIWVHFSKEFQSRAMDRNGLYSIIINDQLSSKEQWEDFGHELCHVLNHASNQLNLPPSFVEMQEQKAKNFMMHFCVPTFMLRSIYLPAERTVEFVSDTFNVTFQTAKARLEMYKRKLYQHKMDDHLREVCRPRTKTFNLSECTDETKRIINQLQKQINKKGLVYNEG